MSNNQYRTQKQRLAAASTMVAAALVATTMLTLSSAGAIEAGDIELLPPAIDGEVIYVPWTATAGPSSANITIDGDLADWAGIPSFVTTRGPLPSADLSANGEMTWSVAAVGSKLYVSATITDSSIIAGEHEDGYWNEDSIEVYLNATDNLDASTYGPGIGQVRFSAVDIGNTDPTALTLSGTNVDEFRVEGLVFATDDGWGFEGDIDYAQWIEPSHGLSLGFQIHANGASTADRDLKLIWSAADVDDVSFDNPSVFGTAVLFELGQSDTPAPATRTKPSATTEAETETTAPPVTEPAPTTTTPQTTVPGDTSTEEPSETVISSDGTPATSSDWTESPLLWLIPLALGILSLAGFAMSRRRPPESIEDDGEGNDLPPL